MITKKSVCVVVPVFNRLALTQRFLDAFMKSDYNNYQIVIIDDASKDGTYEHISSNYPDVKILKGNGNLWWTGGTNLGVKYALQNNFDYILTINNDAVVDSTYLSILVDCIESNPKSIVGSLILRSDNKKIWSVGGHIVWNSVGIFRLNYADQNISAIEGNATMEAEILNGDGTLFPREVFEKIGLYNSNFTPQYHADSEIILRASRRGYRPLICTKAILINEIAKEPLVKSKREILFSKKSDYYMPALLFLYARYSPKRYWHWFFKNYTQFFPDFFLIKFIRSLRRKLLR